MERYPVVTKRQLEIPDVGINETFLRTLEKEFSSLGGDKIADGTYIIKLCTKAFVYSTVGHRCMS